MDYTKSSKPYPAGEISIGGHEFSNELFKYKKLTEDNLDTHGWLKIGDMGSTTE